MPKPIRETPKLMPGSILHSFITAIGQHSCFVICLPDAKEGLKYLKFLPSSGVRL